MMLVRDIRIILSYNCGPDSLHSDAVPFWHRPESLEEESGHYEMAYKDEDDRSAPIGNRQKPESSLQLEFLFRQMVHSYYVHRMILNVYLYLE